MKILNENYMKLQQHLIIICFLFSFIAADPNYISINCGGAAAETALGGRQWLRDAAPKGGSSKASTVKGDLITAIDPVPYKTARISVSQFSYSFPLNPGQKFLRLHFNPASYHGFESSNDLFTVEAGQYTLLGNFSASITARALAVDTLAKEFCIIIREKQHLDLVFSPESKYNYAFINGIEIISIPSTISYCDGGERGLHVLGQKYAIHLESSSTALEMVHRRNIKWGSDDGMFGMWASDTKRAYNRSWTVGVDVGFRYMVRLHLCELGLKMHKDFALLIDDTVALTSPDMLYQKGVGSNHLWYNYMVMVEGHKREGKRNISISLNSQHTFFDRHGPFEGFEVFKLSNHDCSLASPNPPLSSHDAVVAVAVVVHSRISCTTVVITLLCLANIVVCLLHKIRIPPEEEEEAEHSKPSARAKQLCRCFSLTEINIATDYFHPGFVLGKGGFGIVYKGLMDNGREIVAIKRLKPDSKQGEHEFWAEIETLCELRHVNLVSLIGYCREKQEMILVYEYIPSGTLADHLYKLARKSNQYCPPPLSWEQRLNICIGAARAIDYFHTQGFIHRDVKSSNILLDERFVAKVADFGLAKYVATISGGSQSTNLKGTRGYIDPNFYRTHKLTKESDTYSFGVVLLEVLSERAAAAAEAAWNEEGNLSRLAMDKISKGEVNDIVASSLRGLISADSLNTFVKVAERCLLDEPKERPAMTHIIIQLELALVQQQKAESSVDIVEEGNKMIMSGNVASLPREGISNGIIMTSGGRKTLMRNVSRKLWPIWKTRKPSYKTDLLGISVSGMYYYIRMTPYRLQTIYLDRTETTTLHLWHLNRLGF